MIKDVKVSAVIPCFNATKFVSKMIDCVLRQTLNEWELIIVDDGSTDNTLDILKEYSTRDERIRVYSRDREPKGSPTSRNIGLSKAKGEYIVIFDADDLISDTCLEKRVAFMDVNPKVDYASFPARSFTDENKLPIYDEKVRIYGVNKNIDLLSGLLTANYPFTVWTNIYRHKSIKDIQYYEKMSYEDFDFMLSCIFKELKHKYSETKEIDYFYRIIGNQEKMSSKLATEYADATINLFSQKLDLLKSRSDYKKRKREFIQFIVLHFERIIENGNHTNTDNYLIFVKKYFKYLYIILSFISKVTLPVKKEVIRKILLYFQTTVFFFRKRSALLFGSALKHWR